ncbi:MAG: LPXTG cell wall anchor domain-containing protein [Thermoleophilia bacterium]
METGSELLRIAAVGGLLIAGGIALTILSRRKKN